MGDRTITFEDGTTCKPLTDWAAYEALTKEDVLAAELSDPDALPTHSEQLKYAQRGSEIPGETIHEKCDFYAMRPRREKLERNLPIHQLSLLLLISRRKLKSCFKKFM
jgi:hypothetical protein